MRGSCKEWQRRLCECANGACHHSVVSLLHDERSRGDCLLGRRNHSLPKSRRVPLLGTMSSARAGHAQATIAGRIRTPMQKGRLRAIAVNSQIPVESACCSAISSTLYLNIASELHRPVFSEAPSATMPSRRSLATPQWRDDGEQEHPARDDRGHGEQAGSRSSARTGSAC